MARVSLFCSWQGHTEAAKGASMKTRVTPFLMFEGKAQQAMEFYVSLFPDSRVEEVKLYGPGEAGQEGTVERGVFVLAGQRVMCTDSTVQLDCSRSLGKGGSRKLSAETTGTGGG